MESNVLPLDVVLEKGMNGGYTLTRAKVVPLGCYHAVFELHPQWIKKRAIAALHQQRKGSLRWKL
jgi:hypothetical protein